MYRPMSNPPVHVVYPKEHVVWPSNGNLAPRSVPIGIYMSISWPSCDWPTWEDPDLNPIIMPDTMGYSNMGSPNSVACDL